MAMALSHLGVCAPQLHLRDELNRRSEFEVLYSQQSTPLTLGPLHGYSLDVAATTICRGRTAGLIHTGSVEGFCPRVHQPLRLLAGIPNDFVGIIADDGRHGRNP